MPISSATLSAPRSVRRRKIENGISGARCARLDREEDGEQRDGSGDQQQRCGRAPAGVDGVDERVDEQREPGRDGDGAGDVEVARLGLGAALERARAAPAARRGRRSARSRTAPSASRARSSGCRRAARPAAPPAPATAPHTPSARLRSAPSAKVVVMIDSAAGETIAAPVPCTARAAISHGSDWARPPASEASEKTTSPSMNMRRRPIRSASRPPSSRKPPNVSV